MTPILFCCFVLKSSETIIAGQSERVVYTSALINSAFGLQNLVGASAVAIGILQATKSSIVQESGRPKILTHPPRLGVRVWVRVGLVFTELVEPVLVL